LGVITPIGNNVKDYWESLKAGVSGIDTIKTFDASSYDSQIAGEIKNFDPHTFGFTGKDLKRMDRFVLFAVAASREAVKDAGIEPDKEDRRRIGVLIGSGIGSLRTIERESEILARKGPSRLSPFLIPMLIVNEASGQVSIIFGFKGPNSCVATACATGSHAIGDAFKIIQREDADVMIAGGTESAITPLGVGGFCALRALSKRNNDPQRASRPFDRERDGFIMAEGAGVVVLEEFERARRRGAHIYAEIVGYGMSADAYHITAPDPEGEGAAMAMFAALKDAGLSRDDIGYINAHGTSTPLNDKIETLAIKKVFGGRAKELPVSSIKSMTGHLLGAAGGIEFVASCLTIKEGIVPPTINQEFPDPDCDLDYVPNVARQMRVNAVMSNSLGFGGHNASLIVKRI